MIRFAPDVGAPDRATILAAVTRVMSLPTDSAATGAALHASDLDIVSQRLLRCVVRLPLADGRAAFLKVHRLPRAADRLRYLLRRSPALAEWRNLARVRAAGIPCPRGLGVGGTRRWLVVPGPCWVATQAIPASADAAPAPDAVLALVDRLVAARLGHPDLHLDNFLAGADGRVHLLDFQSLRALVGDPSRVRRAMVARCLLGFAVRAGAEISGLSRAWAAAGWIDERDAPALAALAASIHARWLLSRAGRCLRTSTAFVARGVLRRTVLRRGFAWPGIHATGEPIDLAGQALARHATTTPDLVAVRGAVPLLTRLWIGDAWRAWSRREAPALFGLRRWRTSPRAELLCRAGPGDWRATLELDLALAAEPDELRSSLGSQERLIPCVTRWLRAGYNPDRQTGA